MLYLLHTVTVHLLYTVPVVKSQMLFNLVGQCGGEKGGKGVALVDYGST